MHIALRLVGTVTHWFQFKCVLGLPLEKVNVSISASTGYCMHGCTRWGFLPRVLTGGQEEEADLLSTELPLCIVLTIGVFF